MKISEEAILELLLNKNDWVESSFLASAFSVSTRTIRGYIHDINDAHNDQNEQLVVSSYKGYKINKHMYEASVQKGSTDSQTSCETPGQRIVFIIRKLLRLQDPIDIYSLSDELFVSESTIENDLQRVREILRDYRIKLERKKRAVFISGNEQNVRNLMVHCILLAEDDKSEPFSNADFWNDDFDREELTRTIVEIFKAHNLHVDDFGLRILLTQIVVQLERIRIGRTAEVLQQSDTADHTNSFMAALETKKYLEHRFHIAINDSELYLLSIYCHIGSNILDFSLVNSANIDQFVEKKYVDITKAVLQDVEKVYCLKRFDDEFVIRFAIQTRNLIYRKRCNFYTKNPIASKFKVAYPLIYEIAVFIANKFRGMVSSQFNEDEITSIAFYISGHFSSTNNQNKITCVYIHPDYGSFENLEIQKIEKYFGNQIDLISTISVSELNNRSIVADLALTSANIKLSTSGTVVHVNTFLTEDDITVIQNTIKRLAKKRKTEQLARLITRYTNKPLFKRNFYKQNETEMIRTLTEEANFLNLTDKAFTQKVLNREGLSSTSFSSGVAVPHSLEKSAYNSFISVVVNEKPMQWGANNVNIICLIGMSHYDQASFSEMFECLIDVLSKPSNVIKLSKCDTLQQFLDAIIAITEEEP